MVLDVLPTILDDAGIVDMPDEVALPLLDEVAEQVAAQ